MNEPVSPPLLASWEADANAGFHLGAVRQRCRALSVALVNTRTRCVVAYDTRFLSDTIATEIARMLTDHGVSTSFASTPVTIPEALAALRERSTDCVIMITARNQPYWRNGMLVLTRSLPVAAALDKLSLATQPLDEDTFKVSPLSMPTLQRADLRGDYLDTLRAYIDTALIRKTPQTIIVDTMRGATAGLLQTLIGEGSQTKIIGINREDDPLFGRITPVPVDANLARLRKLVRESDSHVGLALSADGTQLGVIDDNGDMLSPAQVAMTIAEYLVRQHRQRGTVILPQPEEPAASIMQEQLVQGFQARTGLRVEVSEQAAQRIVEVARPANHSLLVGCDANGLITIGRTPNGLIPEPAPDALFAAALLVEQIARLGGTLQIDTRSQPPSPSSNNEGGA